MFNHARTLLMNTNGEDRIYASYPGDELIPVRFNKLNLPTYIKVIRTRLFGVSPDRVMLNYRVAQLLHLIEATNLHTHILALDSRITYNSKSNQMVLASTFEPVVTQYGGNSMDILTLIGSAISPDASGQTAYNYQVTIDGVNINIQRVTPPTVTVQNLLNFTASLSDVYLLPYSDYKIRVNSVNPLAAWTIRGFLRPTTALSAIEQSLRSIGEPYLLQLFGVIDEEPYLTFKNCWNGHPDFAHRLGGLVLALVYRTEELRNG